MSVQFIRLWQRRPPDGSLPLGVSCDDEGLLLAGNCRLIQACLDRDGHLFYRARPPSELSTLLAAAYGEPIDATPIYPMVERIAKLMTERNWSRAKLAALHLRLPELADTAAAGRVLRADALLKVTASFDPEKHPRWPKGSQEGHGGEFRPSDGTLVVLVSEPEGSKIQIHFHHWHDQAITKDYMKRGLLTPEAYDFLMNNEFAKSRGIFQDMTDEETRAHLFDAAHRAATAEVRQISEQYLKDNHITTDRPMTAGQAEQLVQDIIISDTRALRAYRELLYNYAESRGSEVERARDGFIRRMGRENSE